MQQQKDISLPITCLNCGGHMGLLFEVLRVAVMIWLVSAQEKCTEQHGLWTPEFRTLDAGTVV